MHTIFAACEVDTLYPARVRFVTFAMYGIDTVSILLSPGRKLILVLDV